MQFVRQCLAEGFGTFFLCFAGMAAVLSSAPPLNSGIGTLGVALANGFAVTVAISCFAAISGAHFNPAITVALLTTGRIKLPMALAYFVCQIVAAMAAAYSCNMLFPDSAIDWTTLALPTPAQWISENVLLITEIVLTFMLTISYYSSLLDPRGVGQKIGAFGIGLTVTVAILATGPVTGACMNPARAFGPAWVLNLYRDHWCYWVGPIAGAILAAQCYENILLPKEPAEAPPQIPSSPVAHKRLRD